ncbi:hypothetical protein [Nonomuraea sp. NPDC050310]|uniref:hypothetical protein n=1 Tax=unclassified Nonomuraea TaxID=2593643 RepID=UPI0033C44684
MTPQSDEDEVWRQIVASFNDTAERDSADQPWPDSENVPPEPEPERRVVKAPEVVAEPDPDEEPEPPHDPADEDHYTPPPPPPLPRVDVVTKVAWVALFGGPAYLLLAAMLGWEMHGLVLFTAVAAFIGGFVTLVVRMGDGPPNDSGWDDGAVV